ncbi:MAG: sulfite exporter TauE/SafE family protein [bacterium]|nr:sulfite exporter TauE/SafE family protein [bacterium]
MYLLGLLLSLIIGIVLGLVGGGGSILTVPLVHYFFGETLFLATTYSLFVVAVASSIGVITRIPKKQIDFRGGIVFVIPSMITAFLIRRYVMHLFPITFSVGGLELSRDVAISVLLIIVMLYTAFRTMFSTKPQAGGSVGVPVVILFGIFTGLLSGFIGAGGGFIIVPILLRMGLDMKKAVGTSMFIIAIQSAVALLGDFSGKALQTDNPIDWTLLTLITVVTVAGVIGGGYLQKYFSGKTLRQVFSYVLIAVSLGMIIQFSVG